MIIVPFFERYLHKAIVMFTFVIEIILKISFRAYNLMTKSKTRSTIL